MDYWELVDHLRSEHPEVRPFGSDRNSLERAHEKAHEVSMSSGRTESEQHGK